MRPGAPQRYSIALSALCVLSALLGACSTEPAPQLRYEVERSLFDADKFRERLSIRPELTTESDQDSLRATYAAVMNQALQALEQIDRSRDNREWVTLQRLAFQAAENARALDFSRQHYRDAYRLLSELIERAPLQAGERLAATLGKARAAQGAGVWDTALTLYNSVVEEFNPPLDPYGRVLVSVLNLPYDIYRNERQLRDESEVQRTVAATEAHYQRLLQLYPNPDLRVATHALLGSFYQDIGRYREAIAHLDSVIDTTGRQALQARVRGWNIAMNDLGEFDMVLPRIRNYKRQSADSLTLPIILFKEGECLIGLRRFNEARDVLYDLKNSHKAFFFSNPLSQGLIAKSFELEGRWDRAENEYRFLAETFPATAEGFSSYLHIINHYRENGPTHLLDTWRERALEFFSEMALRNPGTGVEATAHSFKAEVFRGQGDWQKAVDELTLVVQKFPSSSIGRRSALTGALIYRDKLNDQKMADSLIDLYRKSFPGERDESLL